MLKDDNELETCFQVKKEERKGGKDEGRGKIQIYNIQLCLIKNL